MQDAERTGKYEAAEDIDAIELYFDNGVTDGLPVVPPTEERVQRMLAAATLSVPKARIS